MIATPSIARLLKPSALVRTTIIGSITTRNFATHPPTGHPLEILRKSAAQQMLCDSDGVRRPNVHWVFQLAVAQPFTAPPSLKTVNFQRVSSLGLDFIMKSPDGDYPSTVSVLRERPPVSILYTSGNYMPGEKAEQWRGEGRVEEIKLKDIISIVPHYSIVGIVASKRASDQMHKIEGVITQPSSEPIETEVHRTRIEKHTKFIELVQKTRMELENGNVSPEEIEATITAFRFVPDRMERMVGGPDMVIWDRWEWLLQEDAQGAPSWNVRHLLPY